MKILFLLVWLTYSPTSKSALACQSEALTTSASGVVFSNSATGYRDVTCNLKIEGYASLEAAKTAATKNEIDDGMIFEIATAKRTRITKKAATSYSYEFKEIK